MPLRRMGQRMVGLLHRVGHGLAGLVCALGVAAAATPASADVDLEQFRKDVQWVSARVRTIGTEGYEQTAKYIEQQARPWATGSSSRGMTLR